MTHVSTVATSNVLVTENEDELARIGASLLLITARSVLLNREFFNVVLSGGETPLPLYRYLSSQCSRSIDWSRARFFWSDERNVPPDDPESNYRAANETLLRPLGIPARNIFRIPVDRAQSPSEAERAAFEYERTLRELFKVSPDFDFVLLGLGEDGHTASLFPDAREQWTLAERQGRWVFAPWVPHLSAYRITLLPQILSRGTRVGFLVSGAKKAAMLRAVLSFNGTAPEYFPAQLIHSREGKAFWLVDIDAARELGSAHHAA